MICGNRNVFGVANQSSRFTFLAALRALPNPACMKRSVAYFCFCTTFQRLNDPLVPFIDFTNSTASLYPNYHLSYESDKMNGHLGYTHSLPYVLGCQMQV